MFIPLLMVIIASCGLAIDPGFVYNRKVDVQGVAKAAALAKLVQYGFRRGVSYDLMKLNPTGTAPLRFVVNPVAAPGTGSSAFGIAAVEAFVCSGSMWLPRLSGARSASPNCPRPSRSPPCAALNTRFDQYSGTSCAANGAPPDFNVKPCTCETAGIVKWMSPGSGSAADAPEPSRSYTTFGTRDWAALCKDGPTATTYPSSPPTPYESGNPGTGNFEAPSAANNQLKVPLRRIPNIPLLSRSPSAPAGANAPATVAGIARFFMTIPATEESLVAEFGGMVAERTVFGKVELFP